MAITIIQTPLAIQPAYNPVLFLISSTNTAQANFRFIAEIKNTGGTVLAKLKFPIIPSTIKGWVDVHRILENYLTYDFDVNSILGEEAESSWFEYSVAFGEEYGTTPTEYLNLTSSGALRIFNGALQSVEEFPAYTLAGYVTATGTSEGKWLSAFGSGKRVFINQKDFLHYIALNTTGPASIQVVATLASGGPTTSRFSPGTLGAGRRTYKIPSGPINLNQIAALISGTPGAVIPANTVSYTIQLYDGTAYGPIFTYTIQTNLSIHEDVDVFFMNRLGGFESFRMNMRSEDSKEVQRSSFDKQLVQYDGTNVTYAATSGSKTVYNTDISRSLRLNSDWVTPTENDALFDLISSPIVYTYIGTTLRRINIINSAWLEHKRENDKQKQLEITAQYATMDRRQAQ